ncbi:MAG: IPT/TIG domain-containing protein, partial [Pannonibacter indicus]
VVTVAHQASAARAHGAPAYSYDPPHVARVSGGGPTLGGAMVTVYGANFGGSDHQPQASVGGRPCAATIWVDDTALQCALPAGAGRERGVVVTVGGQASAARPVLSYEPPEVTGVAPGAAGPTDGGNTVEVRGRNFGAAANVVSVEVGGQRCLVSQWVVDDMVRCRMP